MWPFGKSTEKRLKEAVGENEPLKKHGSGRTPNAIVKHGNEDSSLPSLRQQEHRQEWDSPKWEAEIPTGDRVKRPAFSRNLCKDCKKQSREDPSPNGYTEPRKEEILSAYEERSSLRGLERTFGVARSTVSRWLKKNEEDFPH